MISGFSRKLFGIASPTTVRLLSFWLQIENRFSVLMMRRKVVLCSWNYCEEWFWLYVYCRVNCYGHALENFVYLRKMQGEERLREEVD